MEPPDIIVRPAAETDLEAINGIYNPEIEHGIATWDATPWTLDQRRAWFCEHDAMNPVLVAEHAGQVIGFAYVTLVSKKHGWRFTREDTIYISPEFRGLKVGERLLGALLDALRELGVRLVIASITSSNEASIRLHQKFGFEVMGEMKNAGYKFGEWLSTTYLQVDLGEPGPLKPTW
ncbi:MAG: N-acetyltransferase family protein [Microthrixaceae bacterium]|jgi:phosphinothricin acetyltransferase